ncbi:MAG: tetratricopeptide repeat protein [Planctomycetes bacterium]|nr:tetratricopeptide repeat protein [Planctomycetota bacterium]
MEDVSEILKAAIRNHQAGNLQEAEQLYGRVIEENPEHPLALHSLGIVAHQRGQNDVAVGLIAKAISSNPQIPQFRNTHGLVFEAIGRIDEAICSYEKAISLDPDYAEAYLNLAIALQSNGDFAAAVEKCNQITSLFGDSAKAYNLRGYSLEQQANFSEAIESYRQAIRLEPDFAEPYNHIGVIFNVQERYAEAAENCKKALELDPDYAEACNNLGVALNGLELYAEAMENYQKAISLDPGYAEAWYNLANCLQNQNRCAESVEIYKKAIRIKPDYAKAHWNLSHSLLLTGEFSEGWAEYAWRRKPELKIMTYPHQYEQPYWDGSSFAGKRLLVHYEQGFGDNIQFARYLPLVKERGGTVILETRAPLYRLFEQLDGVDEFVQARPDGKACDVRFDLHASPLDMPGLFETTLENIPCKIPYLYAEAAKTAYWRDRVDSGYFKVGLVWSGSESHGNNHNRSCPLRYFAALTKIKGVKLYGLQKGPAARQVEELGADMAVIGLGEEFEDFADTAGAVENMDLVISVDTSVLHLAGAMGKATWALLQFAPDWRWMLKRQDSPWYPTMRLFRQDRPGDWQGLFEQAARMLHKLVKDV